MRRIAVLGTALLLAACHRGGARSDATPTAGLGRPPQQVAKDLFVCPGGYDWYAYRKLVYAPNDSSRPAADVRPDRCFSSLEQADRAGFRLPSPASGGVLIDSIYLVPPSPALTPTCQDAAHRLGFTVLCPGLDRAVRTEGLRLPGSAGPLLLFLRAPGVRGDPLGERGQSPLRPGGPSRPRADGRVPRLRGPPALRARLGPGTRR